MNTFLAAVGTIGCVTVLGCSGQGDEALDPVQEESALSRGLTAAFSASPSASITGEEVVFDSAASTCDLSPCTYAWTDGASSLGSGKLLKFTFHFVGTKHVLLTVKNSNGAKATVEHDHVVTLTTTTPPPPPPPPPPSSGGGNGTITFDGTFSPTGPASGPNWNSLYGGAYAYVPASQVQAATGYVGATTGIVMMTPSSAPKGHARVDLCTGGPGSCTSSGLGQVYKHGVESCTTIPFYFPQASIPSVTGWYQIAEMKSSIVSPDVGQWGMYVNNGGGPEWVVAAQNHTVYSGPVPSGRTWHTGSICTNNSNTIYGIWLDGKRLSFNGSGCSGSGSCNITVWPSGYATQPLNINAYTGQGSTGPEMYHGAPLIMAIPSSGWNGLPPMPAGGWNSP